MNKKVVIIVSIAIVVILVLVGGFLLWNTISKNNPKYRAFSEEDLRIGEITYQSTLEELTSKLGNPGSKREYMEGTTGDKIVECIYEDGKTNIIYRDRNDGKGLVMTSVSSKSNKSVFSRDLQVGMTKEQVLAAFPSSSQVKSEELDKQNKIKFGKDKTKTNATGITYTIQKDVVTEISWSVQQ